MSIENQEQAYTYRIRIADVLLGSGHDCTGRIGALAFKIILQTRMTFFWDPANSQEDKRKLCEDVFENVQSAGGRFLLKNKRFNSPAHDVMGWEVLHPEMALVKIWDCFCCFSNQYSSKRSSDDLLIRAGMPDRFTSEHSYNEIVHDLKTWLQVKSFGDSFLQDANQEQNPHEVVYPIQLQPAQATASITPSPVDVCVAPMTRTSHFCAGKSPLSWQMDSLTCSADDAVFIGTRESPNTSSINQGYYASPQGAETIPRIKSPNLTSPSMLEAHLKHLTCLHEASKESVQASKEDSLCVSSFTNDGSDDDDLSLTGLSLWDELESNNDDDTSVLSMESNTSAQQVIECVIDAFLSF